MRRKLRSSNVGFFIFSKGIIIKLEQFLLGLLDTQSFRQTHYLVQILSTYICTHANKGRMYGSPKMSLTSHNEFKFFKATSLFVD
jgi:hypothetical protein